MSNSRSSGGPAAVKAQEGAGASRAGTLAGAVDDDIATAKQSRLGILRHVVTVVLVIIGLNVAWWFVTNPRFDWGVVAEYFFAAPILRGIGMTLLLTLICFIIGGVLGLVIASMRMSSYAPARLIATGYLTVVRSVPMLVQLILWFNLSYLLPRIIIGVPFGPELFNLDTNSLITPMVAAIIGLSVHDSSYMAEIFRSGLTSVGAGQKDAARALGYTSLQMLFRVQLPQAVRVIIPPAASQFISLMKGTSLVSVIGMTDLLHAAQIIYNQNYEIMPLLLVASIWYLILVGTLTLGQQYIEKRLDLAYSRNASGPKLKRRTKEVAS